MELLSLLQSAAKYPVIGENKAKNERLVAIDLSPGNPRLSPELTPARGLQEFVDQEVERLNGSIGFGGYMEKRQLYGPSEHFSGAEARNIHLGIDIWMPAGSPLYAPLASRVHSFKVNDNYLDYGPCLILEHELEGQRFHTLYGHLSLESMQLHQPGAQIEAGEEIAQLGAVEVNGGWPPHLHFQIVVDMQGMQGDYAGVSAPSNLAFYQKNCPDPAGLLMLPEA